ncbi:hypothetical protein Vadar_006345 [Vaccinium darrowii]|uniref:Uncharacterized protein n=1 Tax=Vaccinium darrowii TaxID=229202 RepID=A0ACB7XXI5_9ERIC|nr:hypothetical protein Vadar_006345 [Vaccinium darrowii]
MTLDDEWDDDTDFACAAIVNGATLMTSSGFYNYDKDPPRKQYLTVRQFTLDLVKSDEDCHNLLRMNIEAFDRLVYILKGTSRLHDTIHCNVAEQLAIFLHAIAHNEKNRSLKCYFKRSGATISYYFNEVMYAIISLHDKFIKPPKAETPQEIKDNPRFWPYFKSVLSQEINGRRAADSTQFDSSIADIENEDLGNGSGINFTQINETGSQLPGSSRGKPSSHPTPRQHGKRARIGAMHIETMSAVAASIQQMAEAMERKTEIEAKSLRPPFPITQNLFQPQLLPSFANARRPESLPCCSVHRFACEGGVVVVVTDVVCWKDGKGGGGEETVLVESSDSSKWW